MADEFRQMSDEELMERWSSGYLTHLAISTARQEFARRGVKPPPYVAKDPDDPPKDERESLLEQPAADFVEVARSKADGDLEAAAARLGAEGIPYRAVRSSRGFSEAAGTQILRLLVPSRFAADARQIISLVNSGAFSFGGDEVGGASGATRPKEFATEDAAPPGRRSNAGTFSVHFMRSDYAGSSPHLIGDGEIEFFGDEIRLRGTLEAFFGPIPRKEVTLHRRQVVNVSQSGRTVSFQVTGGADVERVEARAEDEGGAQAIARLLATTAEDSAVPLQSPAGEAAEEKDFEDRLRSVGGEIWVTDGLVAANVAVFLAAAIAGAGVLIPDVDVMKQLGTNYGPLTTHGEWWRLVTSMFLHFGLLHIGFNMWALLVGGRVVERLFGHRPFLIIYITAGICGSLCSLLWHPMVNSAGASGAIFGVFGAELAFFLRKDTLVPATIAISKRGSTIAFIGFSLFYGLIHPGIDNSAHIGGLLSGFLLGLLLERPLRPERRAMTTAIFYIRGLLVAAAMIGGLFAAVSLRVTV
jgi:membrane associated rhomboid family serine protease